VKVTVQFRGREMTHANLGRDLLDKAAGMLTEQGTIERPPLLEGRSMYIVMAPVEKRAERKTETGEGESANGRPDAQAANGTERETIGDALVARGQLPAKEAAESPSPPAEH